MFSWLAVAASVGCVASFPHELVRREYSLSIETCPGYVTSNLVHSPKGLTVIIMLFRIGHGLIH